MPRKTITQEGPLVDCIVSSCGSLNRTTREVRSTVESFGGEFSSTINAQVTHLIATEEEFEKESAKIKAAKKHKIPIVSEDWLDKIEESGSRPEETGFIIESSSVEKRGASKKKRKLAEEEEEDDELLDEEELQKQKMKRERDLREYYLGSLKSLIDDKLFSDLIFVVPEDLSKPNGPTHKIHAHRAVMAANSSTLKAMIDKSNKKEGNCIVVDIPDVSYDLFSAFLEVAYTGRSKSMKAQHALPLIDLCEKYGMTSFAEYLKFTISTPENVCLLFDAAVQNNNTHIQKWCMSIINKFADRVVVTSSFRELSEQAIKIILDSNFLSLEEVVLFERLIEWADTQIEKRSKENNMEIENSNNNNNNNVENILTDEKAQSKARAQVLAPLLDKIRFPIMHGEELHSVVEPYGVVPDQLLLEAYRFNASPKTFHSVILDTPRFKQRSVLGPKWLTPSHMFALRKFLEGGKLKMEYHAERDGFSNATWRQKLNGIAGSLTIVKTTTGYIFGGYTSVQWSARNSYVADKEAFLFSLAEPTRTRKPEKILQNANQVNAVYDHQSYGPSWGSGHDLHLNFDNKTGGYSQLGYAYVCPPGANQQTYLAGQYNNWTVEDAVIFSVSKK